MYAGRTYANEPAKPMNVKVNLLPKLAVLITVLLSAVLARADGSMSSVDFEAEAGTSGGDFTNGTEGVVQFISISTDTVNTGNPGNASRVATYTITFPVAGTYNLYAKVLVGPDGYSDDSFFYGNGFGIKSATADADWLTVNGLASAGFTSSNDVVTGDGSAGSQTWKWVNVSQFNPSGSGTESAITFTVPAGNLTQTFQIGARENGLELDKFAFGLTNYTFTVADLDAGGPGILFTPAVTINPTITYQTIEGLGGAICFYSGWVTAHPYKLEIFTNAFAGLNLSMLRLGNWFRYQGTTNFDPDAPGFVSNANRILGHPVPVYMSSWAPPAFLKSNGEVGNGGTLITNADGSFAYAQFAQYWYDSIQAYQANGVNLTWASIQNEPDWVASYDSCIFHPTEDTVNGTNYASYSKALDAVYNQLASLPSPPKLLAPETVHISYNDLKNYGATLNSNSFYGVAHHLYGDGNSTGDSFLTAISSAANVFPGKPHFMTEYGDVTNMIECANLIHNCLVVEQVSGYNHWNLIWPGTSGGLIQIENPWNQASWTNAPAGTPTQSHGWWYSPSYWSMKHFSYFIQPGYRRVSATDNDNNVRSSAFLSPDGLRLVVVLINTNPAVASTMDFNATSFPVVSSSVYQTAGTNYFQLLGTVGAQLNLPASSLTTVVLDKSVAVGQAANPSPGPNQSDVEYDMALNWSAGSNALKHAVYLGTSSNAVAQATTASSEFKGILSTHSLAATLSGNTTYFWRVDEIAGANTNAGVVWTFSTATLPALVHRYSFNELSGATTADSVGGSVWNGTLPGGGSFSGGQLTLASASSQYVSLPTGMVNTFSNFTIEAWVKLTTTANWTRIFDFGNNTSSYMFLTPQNGSTARLRFAITTSGSGGEQQITGTSALSAGTWSQVAVTLNGSLGILYLNGIPVGTNSAMTLRPSNLGNTVNNYLGRSQYSGDAYLNAALDEFRIYSVPLSAAEIAATYALGPDQLLTTDSPVLGVNPASSDLMLTWPLASAGFTVQSRTNLVEGNWENVAYPVPQIVGSQWQVTLPSASGSGAVYYRLMK